MIKMPNLQHYEVIRLYSMQKYLQPGVPSPLEETYKNIEHRQPVTVVDSLARSYLKNYNQNDIKRVLKVSLQRYRANEFLLPPMETALVSSFENPELRRYWDEELHLPDLLANKMFLSSIFHLLSSSMFKMRSSHVDLISFIYYRSGEMRQYVVKLAGLGIKNAKVLTPFFDSSKDLVFPLLRDLLNEKFIYREPEMVHGGLRILCKLRLKYETDPSFYDLVAKVYMSHTNFGTLDEASLRFYRRYLDTLMNKLLLKQTHVQAFLKLIETGRKPEDYLDRLRLLNYSKRMLR